MPTKINETVRPTDIPLNEMTQDILILLTFEASYIDDFHSPSLWPMDWDFLSLLLVQNGVWWFLVVIAVALFYLYQFLGRSDVHISILYQVLYGFVQITLAIKSLY